VALPLPLAEPYTDRIPAAFRDRAVPGARVVVPVRNAEMVGILTGLSTEQPSRETRAILAAPDPLPAISDALLRTAEWMAGYYGAPLGLAIRAMLPAALWGRSRLVAHVADRAAMPGGFGADLVRWMGGRGGTASASALARAFRKPVWDTLARLERVGAVTLDVEPADSGAAAATERILVLTDLRPSLAAREELFGKALAQRRLYEALEDLGGSAPLNHLRDQMGFSDHAIRALTARGLSAIEKIERIRDPFSDTAGTPPPETPAPAQREALETLSTLESGNPAVLFGVTGSGKTFVYLEMIREALASGRGAILLVPEISLTPQIVARVRGAFGEEVAVLHSGLSDGERADAWRVLHRGDRRVAVGARSAIFAPVRDLGVIVIDEEHETGYKNGETPRYHARDVALVRARLEGARLVLGSATPAAETMAAVEQGVPLIRMPQRIEAR
ncbi:MAG: DEAD/DEAH box helicase, partial [Gemmatimonadales bacterium]